VSLRLGAAGLVVLRVADDPAGKHCVALGWGMEVHVSAGLAEGAGECLRQFPRSGLHCLGIQDRPDVRLFVGAYRV